MSGWAIAGQIASDLAGKALDYFSAQQSSRREYAYQKEFAQNGIRWRVADAKAAGIHPLAALGTNVTSYSPQAAVGTNFGDIGQNIARALEAKATKEERAETNQLQNDLLRAQIANVNADTSAKRESVVSMALESLSFNRQLNSQTQLPPSMPRTRGVSNMDGISGDINPGSGKVNLASHISPEKAYEAYEVPFHGSQLPLASDEASNMMEGVLGELQWFFRRFEDAQSKGSDIYYDPFTGTYRKNKHLHNFQAMLLSMTPQRILEKLDAVEEKVKSRQKTYGKIYLTSEDREWLKLYQSLRLK